MSSISLENNQGLTSSTEQRYSIRVNSVIDKAVNDAAIFIGHNSLGINLSFPKFPLTTQDNLYAAFKSLLAERFLRERLKNVPQRRKFLDRLFAKKDGDLEIIQEALSMVETENKLALEQDKTDPVHTVAVIGDAIGDLFESTRMLKDMHFDADTHLEPEYVKIWGEKWSAKLR